MVLLKYNMTIWNPWFYSIVQAYAGRCINHLLQRVLKSGTCDPYLLHQHARVDETLVFKHVKCLP